MVVAGDRRRALNGQTEVSFLRGTIHKGLKGTEKGECRTSENGGIQTWRKEGAASGVRREVCRESCLCVLPRGMWPN